jgi:hypothetical protein
MARTAARRSALGLTAAGVLVLAFVWLRASGGTPREERLPPERPERAGHALDASLDHVTPLVDDRPTSQRNAATPVVQESEEAPSPDETQRLEVRVVSSGAPAVGARVVFGPAYR